MTDHFIRPDTQAFLAMLNAMPGPRMHEMSPPEARQGMLLMRQVADADVGALAVIRNLSIPGPTGAIPARLYDARSDRGPGPVMVFYHGGGFVIGDLDTHEPYCAEAARQLDMPVIAIDYRLAPEHPYPAAADDCEAATRWIATSPSELGLTVTGLIPSGDSAGGNLTIVVAQALRDAPAAVPVILQFPIYPVVTGSADWQSFRDYSEGYLLTADSMNWFSNAYQADPDHIRSAPLGHSHGGTPPTLIVTAGLDPLRDQGRAYAAELIKAGVDVTYIELPGTIHGFINLRKGIPSTQADLDRMFAALRTMLAALPATA